MAVGQDSVVDRPPSAGGPVTQDRGTRLEFDKPRILGWDGVFRSAFRPGRRRHVVTISTGRPSTRRRLGQKIVSDYQTLPMQSVAR